MSPPAGNFIIWTSWRYYTMLENKNSNGYSGCGMTWSKKRKRNGWHEYRKCHGHESMNLWRKQSWRQSKAKFKFSFYFHNFKTVLHICVKYFTSSCSLFFIFVVLYNVVISSRVKNDDILLLLRSLFEYLAEEKDGEI